MRGATGQKSTLKTNPDQGGLVCVPAGEPRLFLPHVTRKAVWGAQAPRGPAETPAVGLALAHASLQATFSHPAEHNATSD